MALKVYHRDASPTELHILICKMADIRLCAQILTDQLAQDAIAFAMENAHSGHAHENGIVNEIADRLQMK